MELIDKNALSMELTNEVLNAYAKADFRFAHALNVFQGLIDEAPTVEERKQGYWLKKHHVSDASEFIAICCSSCGYKVDFFWNDWQNSKYCPNCGAKMRDNNVQ